MSQKSTSADSRSSFRQRRIAVLIAGPAINLASLLVIARQSHWKVALLVGAGVWVTAVAGGLLIG
jgi:uncharacterized membrane protein YraQ (UPF0718 family)